MSSLRPRSDVVYTTLDEEESVLLDLNTRRYYTLNETGARIWELLDEDHSPGEIAAHLAQEWAISEEEAQRHVEDHLEELQEEGLLESSDQAE